eukprot:203352-Prorocentrum_minimum.AAC.1
MTSSWTSSFLSAGPRWRGRRVVTRLPLPSHGQGHGKKFFLCLHDRTTSARGATPAGMKFPGCGNLP